MYEMVAFMLLELEGVQTASLNMMRLPHVTSSSEILSKEMFKSRVMRLSSSSTELADGMRKDAEAEAAPSDIEINDAEVDVAPSEILHNMPPTSSASSLAYKKPWDKKPSMPSETDRLPEAMTGA